MRIGTRRAASGLAAAGLLAVGLAAGTGVASAAVPAGACSFTNLVTGVETLYNVTPTVTANTNGQCVTGGQPAVASDVTDLSVYVAPPEPTTTTTTPKPVPTTTTAPVAAPAAAAPPVRQAPPPPVAPPVLLPPPPVFALPPVAPFNPALLTPTSQPIDPAAFAYNPGLLLAAPPGSPLRMAGMNDPASAVTSASDVQAMAFNAPGGGLGVPAVLGVLILSGLAGFAVRHRMLARRRSLATAVGG